MTPSKKRVPNAASDIPQYREKTPQVAQPVGPPIKQPRALGVDLDEVLKRRPVWRFAEVDHDGPWCFDKINPADVVKMFKKLGTYETMTLGELFKPGSQHGKTYAVEQMPRQGPNRLAEIEHDDETEISRVSLSGQARLYGFLREHVFHVLWYDPRHEVWPSKKKHT